VLGWQGLALWVALLGWGVGSAFRRALATGEAWPLCAGVQLAVVAAAMATDYVVEVPYLKLVVVLALFLAFPPPAPAPRSAVAPLARRALAAAAVAAALAGAALGACHLAKARESAALEGWHAALLPAPAGSPLQAAALAAIARHGRRFAALPGLGKTHFRDYLVLAHAAHTAGDGAAARARVRRALALHPYSPNAWALAAEIVAAEEPALAAAYRETARYILDEATAGFRRVPPPPPAG
jgi:hypothetical protein